MKKEILILTDHKRHSVENSLYDLSVNMLAHVKTESVTIASRVNPLNEDFFNCIKDAKLYATVITSEFAFQENNHPLESNFTEINIASYELVWLRLPPPLTEQFLEYIDTTFSEAIVINNPKAIYQTGSKEFLMNFKDVCPPMKVCYTIDDIIQFKTAHPIVLKPFREYGGKGIIRVNNNEVSKGNSKLSFQEFTEEYKKNPVDYLGVKYLKNVGLGDKRVIVVNGEILGASLRLPAEGSWICNVSMGGSSNMAEVDTQEEEIVQLIDPILKKLGIVMYGVDTLVGDNGKRVLSEINTTSIGGLPQIAKLKNKPLVEKAIDLIWEYYEEQKKLKK